MAKQFIVETSARHVHVTKETLATLFGAGAVLHNKKNLSQPGQFACEEKVTVVGPKGSLKCSILGPERSADQVEVSFTDARALGVVPPVRESGDLAGSAPCKLVGPAGEVELSEGVIVAKRHIHLTPADAEEMGVKDKDVVSVKVETGEEASPSARSSAASALPTRWQCTSTPTRPTPPAAPAPSWARL